MFMCSREHTRARARVYAHAYVCDTYEAYVERRLRLSHRGDPVRYTPHNVVQTPWARRTAFQGGSVDVAHDGVRGGGEEEDEEEDEEGGEVGLECEGETERNGGREKEGALENNSIKRRTPSN